MGHCSIHFVNRGTNNFARSNPVHAHQFWQLEIGIEGIIKAFVGEELVSLNPGGIFCIPPNVQHSFRYTSDPVRWLSLKYHFEQPKGVSFGDFRSIHDCPYTTPLRDLLLRTAYDRSLPDEQCAKILCGLLSVFMDYNFPERRIEEPPLVRDVHSVLREKEGRHLTIAMIASVLNYSAGHVANMYKKLTGVALKQAIDTERAKTAEGLIKHTTMNMSEIARQLEFGNIYSFSRFVRHHTGLSPLQLRNADRSTPGNVADFSPGSST